MAIDSADLAYRVRQALLDDPRTSRGTYEVLVQGSVVTLTGVVDDLRQKMAAEEIARQQVGVTEVINQLTG